MANSMKAIVSIVVATQLVCIIISMEITMMESGTTTDVWAKDAFFVKTVLNCQERLQKTRLMAK